VTRMGPQRIGVAGDRMDWTLRSQDARAVPPLRREIMAFLRRQTTADGDFASAELVIGELLSNAVAHSQVRARVSLRWEGEHPVLSVADVGRPTRRLTSTTDRPSVPASGPVGMPEPALPTDPLADGGRGLYIADQLSRGLAVQTRPAGSVVSATLDLRRRPVTNPTAAGNARPA
jgi:anti-sigma regulatory factor (Ser/Thr protein kinase)